MKSRWCWVAAAAVGLALATPPAFAAWNTTGSGSAGGAATVMPAGSAPSISVTGGSVALRWSASGIAGGTPVAGYVIKRYSVNGTPAVVGAGCSGVVTTTTCTETGVASGSWTYTVTPVQDNWSGAESPATPATV
jgi:hypothetical protein